MKFINKKEIFRGQYENSDCNDYIMFYLSRGICQPRELLITFY